jgi:Protein of unknown function (DUF4231)
MSDRVENPSPAKLVIRVGVTGHRTGGLEELGANPAVLKGSIEDVLKVVEEIAQEVAEARGSLYACEKSADSKESERPMKPVLRIVSALAEGADRLVTEIALARGYELQCVFPFQHGEYSKDFETEKSKEQFEELSKKSASTLELGGNPENRPEAYLAAGRILLLQSDVLIAVWDGAPAKGVGGTGQVVEEALQIQVPTVRIDARPPHSPRLWLPGKRPDDAPRTADVIGLNQRLEASLLLPRPRGEAQPNLQRAHAKRFFREKQPKLNWGLFFQVFRLLLAGQWRDFRKLHFFLPDFQAEHYHRWSAGWHELPARQKIEKNFLAHFDWADQLAERYGGLYRSSFLVAYILGAFAVFFAFLGIAAGEEPSLHWYLNWFVYELAAIACILVITFLGRILHWHERWMDYRLLAEGLRQMEFLALIGRVPASLKVAPHLKPSDPGRSWFNWYFRALVRQAGLVAGCLDREYLVSYRKVLAGAIAGQADYHSRNHRSLERLHRRLHRLGQGVFILAAVACALHVLPVQNLLPKCIFPPFYEKVLRFCAIVLPALGAAVGAIIHHGEFERLCLRSHALATRLEQLRRECVAAGPDARRLGHLAEEFSQVMMAELIDWRFVFLDKNLVLPA